MSDSESGKPEVESNEDYQVLSISKDGLDVFYSDTVNESSADVASLSSELEKKHISEDSPVTPERVKKEVVTVTPPRNAGEETSQKKISPPPTPFTAFRSTPSTKGAEPRESKLGTKAQRTVNKVLEAKQLFKKDPDIKHTKMVVIIWEVSFLRAENICSADAFTDKAIAPLNNSTNQSIRRGLHDIFGHNLGFETMNSLSTLCAPLGQLSYLLYGSGNHDNIEEEDLLQALRNRIDELITVGLLDLAFTDFGRAAKWLSGIISLRCDDAPLVRRTESSPFTMFIATRTDAFNRREW